MTSEPDLAGSASLRASPGFAAAVLLGLAVAGLLGLMVGLMASGLDVLLPAAFAGMAHFTEPHHRIHDLTFGLLFMPAVVGLLGQLRDPVNNVAGQLMALIPSAALLLTVALSSSANVVQPPWVMVGAAALVATVLHPARERFFESFSVTKVNWLLLGLVILALTPLLMFTSTNLTLQRTLSDDHGAAGHYGFMAAAGMTVIAAGVLASWRPDGWRLTAWVTGLLPALLGISSFVSPGASSPLSPSWALAAVIWGVVFVATAERIQRATVRADTAHRRLTATSAGERGSASHPQRA